MSLNQFVATTLICTVSLSGLTSSPVTHAESPDQAFSTVLIDISGVPGFHRPGAGSSLRDITKFIDSLKMNIGLENWKQGTSIALHPSVDSLVVVQTPRNQQKLFQLIRRMRLFAKTYDRETWTQLLTSASERQKRVLVVVGEMESPECERFFQFWDSGDDDELDEEAVFADSYELHCMSPRTATQLGNTLQTPLDLLQLGLHVFSNDGQVAHHLQQDASPDERIQFLNRHRIRLPHADTVFESALRSATKNDKLIFALFSNAKGCGSCDRLKALLAHHQSAFETDYLTVIIDTRMPEAEALGARIGKTDGWVPWYAIVSADGKTLINSESKTGNIGFPYDQADRTHFQKMIESTRKLLGDHELQSIMKTLRGNR